MVLSTVQMHVALRPAGRGVEFCLSVSSGYCRVGPGGVAVIKRGGRDLSVRCWLNIGPREQLVLDFTVLV